MSGSSSRQTRGNHGRRRAAEPSKITHKHMQYTVSGAAQRRPTTRTETPPSFSAVSLLESVHFFLIGLWQGRWRKLTCHVCYRNIKVNNQTIVNGNAVAVCCKDWKVASMNPMQRYLGGRDDETLVGVLLGSAQNL